MPWRHRVHTSLLIAGDCARGCALPPCPSCRAAAGCCPAPPAGWCTAGCRWRSMSSRASSGGCSMPSLPAAAAAAVALPPLLLPTPSSEMAARMADTSANDIAAPSPLAAACDGLLPRLSCQQGMFGSAATRSRTITTTPSRCCCSCPERTSNWAVASQECQAWIMLLTGCERWRQPRRRGAARRVRLHEQLCRALPKLVHLCRVIHIVNLNS